MCWRASCHLHGHSRCAIVRSLTLCSSPCSFPSVSPILSSTWTLSWTSSSMWPSSGQKNHWHSAKWGVWPLGRKHTSHRLWAQRPWRFPPLRDFWNLLPGAIQRHSALVLVWCRARWWDHQESALFSTVHSGARRTFGPKTSLSLLWRKFVASSVIFAHSRTGRPMHELSSLSSCRENQVVKWKTKESGFSLKDKKSKFSLKSERRFISTSSKPILIEEVSRNWVELLSLSEEKLIILLHVMNNFDEINNFFMNNYQHKIGIFVKLIWKVSMRWKNWSDFKFLHSMDFREENWSKIEILLMNSQARFRNYRIKSIVWMIREILRMLNQYAVD